MIVETYCKHFNIIYDDEIKSLAIQWSLQRGNRTGRTGWQFIVQLAAERDLKIIF